MLRTILAVLLVLGSVLSVRAEPGPAARSAYEAATEGAIVLDAVPVNGRADNPNPEQWWGADPASLAVRNVSHPTLTPVLPEEDKANGAAVVVVPGGALLALSMGNEGMDVAWALVDRGYVAFVLKYRTEPTPPDDAAFAAEVKKGIAWFLASGGGEALPGEAAAKADALAAMRLVRARAETWGIDPARIGMVGFSAGAITVRNVVLADEADARPAFAGLIYGQMLRRDPPQNAPPLFVALAADDPLFGRQGFGLVEAWRDAGLPVELHYYQTGSHGFGIAKKGTTSDGWFTAFAAWLDANGVARAQR